MAVRGVRYRPDTGWEMRCEGCYQQHQQCYWPLDLEFWDPRKGLARCRACHAAAKRVAMKLLRSKNPEADRERVRQYREANKAVLALKARVRRSEWDDVRRAAEAAKDKAWRERNPDRWREIKRHYRENHREQERVRAREYARKRRAALKERAEAA